ncbi:deoxynucleotidyltransferase terminal-interacting protein 2 [Anarrhichthys ocellatus]|uniref:deoxynucleotidyltransferase terminal-interacting protein 2 n=1 Tax=Anarrhichthys ocellatus TaxID=433405 RepID=UPI0012EDD244|nr:deoxynucleotidyltransferase terminal-interacting protein 2 [Anarrhichthys ocellatus]
MVATRRGVRVCSPTKTNPEQSSDVPATPSLGRRTRGTAKQAEPPTQSALVETSSQLEKSEGQLQASPPTSLLKRCTRASRLHSPEQSCTPVGSVHEADQEDSCCSAVFDAKLPTTRTRGSNVIVLREDDEIPEVDSWCSPMVDGELPMTRGNRRTQRIVLREDDEIPEADSWCSPMVDGELPMTRGNRRTHRIVLREDDEISEVESCSSAVSASKASQSVRRSTRRKTIPKSPVPAEVGDVKVESVSKSQRVARSQRKTAGPRSSAKQQTEDSELSDADSYVSSVSTTRRATRSRRQTGPIPLHLDETSEGSQSPAPRARMSRAAKGSAAAAVDVSEPQSCDSEGFESGPTYSMTTRRWGKTRPACPKALDSDSEPADGHSQMGSPCTTRSKETPCSSRTGSGSSSRSARAARSSIKDCSIVLEKTMEDTSINDSMLERTVILADADCTLLEGDENQPLEEKEKEKEGVDRTDLTPTEADTMSVEKGVVVISEEDSPSWSLKISDSPACAEEAVITPAVTDRHQQEEPRAENTDGDASEKTVMQETIQPSEPLKPQQSATATSCESASEITEETEEKDEAMEVAHVDAHAPQGDEDAAVETGPSEEEKMEVSTLNIDAQQVVDSNEVQVESIQVTSSQQQSITVDSDPEQQPKDVIVQNTKIISLLESSEDEDEEREVSGEVEEDEFPAEERAGPSQKCEAAAASVEGLFMIDTRPGQEADEQYYKERPTEEQEKATKEDKVEQEEQDEEFVDEEGDDDDEDAEFLFSSRNPQLKGMSSRIDPGFRVKELGGLYINFDGSKSKPVSTSLRKLKEKKIQDEVMKKSVIGPEFEKKDAVPPYSESKRAVKLKNRTERAKSTGDGWFNMKAPEITQELKGDLQVLKMRGSMDPKRFYKKNDRDGFPKYFQVGTVVDNPVDFYHSRVPKRARKRTMVEELLSDAEFRHNNKKKYQHIVTERAAQGAGKRSKKSKFHKK